MATTILEMEGASNPEFNGYQKVKWDWLSDSDGAVSSQTSYNYSGMIVKAIIIPDGGATAPTAAYDMTITNSDSIDILEGNGVDCSATATEYLDQSDGLGCVLDSKLTLTIAAAGEAKGGLVYLYIA